VIGTVAMIGFSGVECVATKAVAAAAKLGEIVEGVVDFAAQVVSGTLDPPISFRQRIGSWSANFDGGFRRTYNRHIENEWEGRRLAEATCLRCSDHQGSLMCSTDRGVSYCPPVEGENHLHLLGGGNCVYLLPPLVYTYAPPSIPQAVLLPPPLPPKNSSSMEENSSYEVANTSYIAAQPPVGMGRDTEQGIRITLITLGILAASVAGILAFVALWRYRFKTRRSKIVELHGTRHELQLTGKHTQLQV